MSDVELMIRPYHASDEIQVVELWVRCNLRRSVNNRYRDIQRKLAVGGELFLVGAIGDRVVATVMAGYDGHRGAVYYVGVDPEYQRQGFGRAMLLETERRLAALGCPKINLIVRGENKAVIAFYERLGYADEKNVQMGKRLVADEGLPETPAGIEEDDAFLKKFEDASWPLDQWHHRQHIKVAYLFLRKLGLDEAGRRIAASIRAYNTAHKIPDTPTSGYHETMTQAWVRLVDFAMKQYGPAKNADDFFDSHPELWQTKTLRLFYSRELFMSAEAKQRFVAPDLTQFPRTSVNP